MCLTISFIQYIEQELHWRYRMPMAWIFNSCTFKVFSSFFSGISTPISLASKHVYGYLNLKIIKKNRCSFRILRWNWGVLTLFVSWKVNRIIYFAFFLVSGGVQYITFQLNERDAVGRHRLDTHQCKLVELHWLQWNQTSWLMVAVAVACVFIRSHKIRTLAIAVMCGSYYLIKINIYVLSKSVYVLIR